MYYHHRAYASVIQLNHEYYNQSQANFTPSSQYYRWYISFSVSDRSRHYVERFLVTGHGNLPSWASGVILYRSSNVVFSSDWLCSGAVFGLVVAVSLHRRFAGFFLEVHQRLKKQYQYF